jgi:effector-binding domain-containing protein
MTDIRNEPSIVKLEVRRVPRRRVLGLRERTSITELAAFFARAIPAVLDELARHNLTPAGPPIAVYRDEHGHQFQVTMGFPVARAPALVPCGPLVMEDLPGGQVVSAEHVGPYETLGGTYAALSEWFTDHKLVPPWMMWEEYLVGPGAAAETAYHTRVVYPLPWGGRPVTAECGDGR